jgi:hypothetical protein
VDDSNYDIAALIELLKMAGERWPCVEDGKLSATEHIRQVVPFLKCGRRLVDAPEWASENFRLELSNSGSRD